MKLKTQMVISETQKTHMVNLKPTIKEESSLTTTFFVCKVKNNLLILYYESKRKDKRKRIQEKLVSF